MAAILCTSISDGCSSFFKGLGQAVCVPCQACGFSFDRIGEICASPFFPFLAVTVGCNLPSMLFGIQSNVTTGEEECSTYQQWQAINAGFCLAHIVAAFYIVRVIQADREDELMSDYEASHSPRGGKENSLKRINQVLCYDPKVATYIVVAIFYLIWHFVGTARMLSGGDCDGIIRGNFIKVLMFNYLFMSMGFITFVCSVCCMSTKAALSSSDSGPSSTSKAKEAASAAKAAATVLLGNSEKNKAQAY